MRSPLHRGAALAVLALVVVAGAAVPVTAATGDADVAVSPTSQRVAPTGTVTYAITADVDDGVGSYALNVSVDDTATATIADANNEIGGTARTAVDEDSARLVVTGGDTVDDGEALLATVTIRGEAAGNASLSVAPDSVTAEDASGQYTVTSVENGTVRVADAPAPETSLTMRPPGRGITPGDRVTYRITATDVRGGVDAIDLSVALDGATTARIVDVTSGIGGDAQTTVDDGSARLFVTGGDTVDDGEDVVIATVTVVGERPGDATLSVTPHSVSPETGADAYRIADTTDARLDVVETAPTIGASDAPPIDPDDDGAFEDVTGDGEVTPGDATVLYNAIQAGDPAVLTNPEMCDVDGDRQVTTADARALFRQAFAG